MARALDFTRQFALAARAVARLAARLDLARLGDKALQRVDVLVVEALAVRTVGLATAAPAPETAPVVAFAVFALAAALAVLAVATIPAFAWAAFIHLVVNIAHD